MSAESDFESALTAPNRRHQMAKIWHRMYINWYDNDRAGNRVRAALWGFAADVTVRFV